MPDAHDPKPGTPVTVTITPKVDWSEMRASLARLLAALDGVIAAEQKPVEAPAECAQITARELAARELAARAAARGIGNHPHVTMYRPTINPFERVGRFITTQVPRKASEEICLMPHAPYTRLCGMRFDRAELRCSSGDWMRISTTLRTWLSEIRCQLEYSRPIRVIVDDVDYYDSYANGDILSAGHSTDRPCPKP